MRKDLVKYRLEDSKDKLDSSEMLFDKGKHKDKEDAENQLNSAKDFVQKIERALNEILKNDIYQTST